MADLGAPHLYRTGPHEGAFLSRDELTASDQLRKYIEPWLTAVFQSEHLSLLLGSGFPAAVATAAGGQSSSMGTRQFGLEKLEDCINAYATDSAKRLARGTPNLEDQMRAAIQLRDGLRVLGDGRHEKVQSRLDAVLRGFILDVLAGERSIGDAETQQRSAAHELLVSFLMSFASRAASRERLGIFTTNYDRLVEYGCDLAGLHVIDRFVGGLSPIFRSSRLNIDVHYNPPGIRGEPRYLEGVVRLTKLHGSLDWRWNGEQLRRCGLPFGAADGHPEIPTAPTDSVMVYPNPAKDTETLDYPYAELFRDFAAAVCRPNSALVTYGYGFGDDHINRTIRDMLTIPSTHLVVVCWDETDPNDPEAPANTTRTRLSRFFESVGRPPQVSLLLGSHFGDIYTLVAHYLPKPAIDEISIRRSILLERRGDEPRAEREGGGEGQAHSCTGGPLS